MDISGPVEISYLKDLLDDNYLLDDQNRNTIKIRAYIDFMNHSEKNYYPGCFDCKKKLSQDQDGWFCQTCNKKFNEPKYYFTINCKVRDLTGESWIEMFGDTASKFLGISVEEYKDIIINNDQSKINELIKKIDYKEFFFYGKVRISTYNNITKKRIAVYRFEGINQKVESEKLIKLFSTILV
jgi:replication factor A1